MKIPEKWQKYDLDYAEYVIYLPKEWDINSGDEKGIRYRVLDLERESGV